MNCMLFVTYIKPLLFNVHELLQNGIKHAFQQNVPFSMFLHGHYTWYLIMLTQFFLLSFTTTVAFGK